MNSSEETKNEEQLCLQCGVVVSAQAEYVGIEQVSSIRLCASCLEDAPESVKGGEAALLDLEELPPKISSSSPAREASVSLRAPPPPRRVSQAAAQNPTTSQDTPSLQLIVKAENAADQLEAVYQPLDQGSLTPVTWEDDSGILQIKTPVITRSVPPPLPPRPSRRPRSTPSSDQLLHDMGGLAHSVPVHPVINLAPSGVIAPVRKRRKKALLLSASIFLAFGMTAGLTYVIATNAPVASQGQGALTPAASPLPMAALSTNVSEPTPGPALPVVKAPEIVETAKKTPAPLKEKPKAQRRPLPKKSSSKTRAQPTAAAPAVAPAVAPAPPVEEQPAVRKFDIRALKSGVNDVMASIGSCRNAADPSGIAKVVMVFSTSGRVTSATVSGPPFAGTTTGGCIASRFRALRLPAFDGERRTIRKTVVVQ